MAKDNKVSLTTNNDVKCGNCQATVRIQSLIKLKNRYCCPYCFSTVKVKKEK